jgi:hypothetical protein
MSCNRIPNLGHTRTNVALLRCHSTPTPLLFQNYLHLKHKFEINLPTCFNSRVDSLKRFQSSFPICRLFSQVMLLSMNQKNPTFQNSLRVSSGQASALRSTRGCRNSWRKAAFQCTITYGTFVKWWTTTFQIVSQIREHLKKAKW